MQSYQFGDFEPFSWSRSLKNKLLFFLHFFFCFCLFVKHVFCFECGSSEHLLYFFEKERQMSGSTFHALTVEHFVVKTWKRLIVCINEIFLHHFLSFYHTSLLLLNQFCARMFGRKKILFANFFKQMCSFKNKIKMECFAFEKDLLQMLSFTPDLTFTWWWFMYTGRNSPWISGFGC